SNIWASSTPTGRVEMARLHERSALVLLTHCVQRRSNGQKLFSPSGFVKKSNEYHLGFSKSTRSHVGAVYEGEKELESSACSPLLASPQGGEAERSRNIAKHPLIAKPGWFSDENKKVNHPGCVQFGGYAKFY